MSGPASATLQQALPPGSSFVRRIVAGVALVNLFVFAVVGYALYQSHGQFVERAEISARNLSQMLAQELSGNFDKINLALFAVVDETERQLAIGGIDTVALNAFLARQQRRLPEISSMRMTDANGVVSYGLGVNPNARPNNSDRDYFYLQRDNPQAGLVIAKPVLARIDKKWVIPISRAIHRPDGSFAGVVYVNVPLEHLAKDFASIDIGQRGSVSLRDTELRVFARHPLPRDLAKVIGVRLAVPELAAMIQAGRDTGSYISRHTVDGVERKFTVRKLAGYPFYVVFGRASDEVMARWREQANTAAILLALFSLTTLIASRLVYLSWRSQYAASLELAREEEKFHTVADYTYDWEYWEGPGHEILFMSPSCARVTGYTQAEFLTDPTLLYRIIHPDDRHLMAEHQHDAEHEDEAGADFRIVRRDGEIRWIAHGCKRVFSHDGQFMGRRANNRDITDRKQAEAAVRQFNAELELRVAQRTAQLEEANKELEEFSYSISHDLRTPLRAIAGFAQILLDEHSSGLDDESRRLLDVVRSNTVRMGQLIDELLEFLRLGRRPLQFASVDMAQLAREVFDELRAGVPERELQLELKATLPPLWGDRTMLRQLLGNLLSNAIKFTRPRARATIEIGGDHDGDASHYYIKDNGVGFDMKYVDKLFKVFEHLHPAGEFEGSGTGLAMARRIVSRHGGRIWAEGQVDVGATVHFTLPKEHPHDGQ